MKVAVITPYYDETEATLRRCHDSVLAQTYRCTHIMVADGKPNAIVDNFDAQHFRLPISHGDYGDTPRAIGSFSAIRQGFEAIAFLDADNWYFPGHIESMVELHRRTGAAVCTTLRNLYRLDGSYLATCLASDGEQFSDTNCLFLTRAAYHLIDTWVLMDRDFHAIGDRIFWHTIKTSGLTRAHYSEPTVGYLATHAGFYRDLGEPIPPGLTEPTWAYDALRRWKAKGGPSLDFKIRYRRS